MPSTCWYQSWWFVKPRAKLSARWNRKIGERERRQQAPLAFKSIHHPATPGTFIMATGEMSIERIASSCRSRSSSSRHNGTYSVISAVQLFWLIVVLCSCALTVYLFLRERERRSPFSFRKDSSGWFVSSVTHLWCAHSFFVVERKK